MTVRTEADAVFEALKLFNQVLHPSSGLKRLDHQLRRRLKELGYHVYTDHDTEELKVMRQPHSVSTEEPFRP